MRKYIPSPSYDTRSVEPVQSLFWMTFKWGKNHCPRAFWAVDEADAEEQGRAWVAGFNDDTMSFVKVEEAA